jgi:uncharacterized protein YbaR (Trm112 family)
MFIELAEFLRCPEAHDPDPYLVLVPDGMEGRQVTSGNVACPTCRREYPIVDGVVQFGAADATRDPPALPDGGAIQALLGLGGPGGYVVLVGSAAAAAAQLADRMKGIQFVAVNAPAGVETPSVLSRLVHPAMLPLKTSMVRGVVVGDAHCYASWLDEGARVLLRGRRLVALRETVPPTADISPLASGRGMSVGEKT